ncbi:MAG: hypothetical protein JKX94_05105, partial [Sneathiella sp.]|nr:hypothetical protein [Sneathiella sp.]
AEEIGKADLACDLAAVLSERDFLRFDREAPNSDIRSRLEIINKARREKKERPEIRNVLRSANDLRRRFKGTKHAAILDQVGTILAFAYPDRIGELRKKSTTNYRLSGGRGATLLNNDKLQGEPYLVVADLDGKGRDARIYLAASIRYQELIHQFSDDLSTEIRVFWDEQKERIIAQEETKIGALILDEKRVKSPPEEDIARALLDVIRNKKMRMLPWDKGSTSIRERVAFARHHDTQLSDWPDLSESWLLENLTEWLLPYLAGKNSLLGLQDLKLEEILRSLLTWEQQSRLKNFAPDFIVVPTGSNIRLDYSDLQGPVLAVRLQEMFGQADVAKVADGKVAISIHLLSPARRPAQITQDLAGFWKNTYADVKKDLKGQYPRHYWPDDPLQAEPTARAKPRKR